MSHADVITIGASLLHISLPLFVAEREKLFKRRGVTISFETYETSQPMIQEIADGRIDAAGFIAFPIVLEAARYVAEPPAMAAGLIEDPGHRLCYALAAAGSGLSFPLDSRARRVGILPTAAFRDWLEQILVAATVPVGEVTIVPIAPGQQGRALKNGEIDLLFTNDPTATMLLQHGVAEIADGGPPCARWLGDPFPFGGFALSARFSRGRPDAAEQVVGAVDDAIELIRRDPARARRSLLDWFEPDESAVIDSLPDARYLTSTEAGVGFVDREIAREAALGRTARVRSWKPARD
ncbi:MAG: hypothetical protein WCJ30_16875 [Deltaproteobacteria bacterium]